jgi:hypothetical protein
VALDGAPLRVPNVPECTAYFGGMHTSCGKFRPLARASALLDVAWGPLWMPRLAGSLRKNEVWRDVILDKLNPDDLLVMDRA